ncbi:MAG: hypothetical protein WB440_15485 [Steroidobacteraceae bacterium]|jgi:gamma-glutamylcyclotransferase (GGCT)/AIG2-like uncharacterized protein YtfP
MTTNPLSDIWETLGITRTGDKTVIRRAYVRRLRAIDVEADPAAFMALRAAYEAALEQAEEETLTVDSGAQSEGTADAHRESEPRPEPPAPTEAQQLQAELRRLDFALTERLDDLESTRQRDGLIAAWQSFNRATARGEIPLDQQPWFCMYLLREAVDEREITPADFMKMVEELGPLDAPWRYDGFSVLHDNVKRRVEACHWLTSLQQTAKQPAAGKDKFSVRAAQLFLKQRRKLGNRQEDRQALEALLKNHQAHASVLKGWLDADWLQALQVRVERRARGLAALASMLSGLNTLFGRYTGIFDRINHWAMRATVSDFLGAILLGVFVLCFTVLVLANTVEILDHVLGIEGAAANGAPAAQHR